MTVTPPLATAQRIQLTEPQADQRAVRIKAELEKEGLKVYEVRYQPVNGGSRANWIAWTAANYATPTWPSVLSQALLTWWVMHDIVGTNSSDLDFVAGQVWTKYVIGLGQSGDKVAAFVSAWKAAKTPEERKAASNIAVGRIIFRVFDTEKRRYVDHKDFINKNFDS